MHFWPVDAADPCCYCAIRDKEAICGPWSRLSGTVFGNSARSAAPPRKMTSSQSELRMQRKVRMRYAWAWLVALLLVTGALAQTPPPVLFFSDLTSGTATGNSDSTYMSGGGVYVTLYGNFFGSSPAVTLNGASCLITVLQPSSWLWYQRMVVQVGKTCTSGNFVVTTAAGSSNGLAFTVNSGTIYYVSTSGADG